MHDNEPSRTALAAAAYRAAHQTADGATVFADPFARIVLGADADAIMAKSEAADPAHRRMRMFIAARSRFAEDAIAQAVVRGVRQAVVLGAGLDTFALRNPHRGQGLRVIEADHPATQAWKRKRLAEAGMAVPAWMTFAPTDLQREGLAPALLDAGLQPGEPAFFHWLGVVPYLPRQAVAATLQLIAGMPGSEVVFDYTEPLENYSEDRRAYVNEHAARVAAVGEPWVTYFDPAALSAELSALGFGEQEDLGIADIAARYLGPLPRQAKNGPGPHLIRAKK
ncbi:MAG TPA: SAM-dependent methyltransferase [Hyphomicrobiaceae bacterium]|jgi:methyltransferase (TIGR00027 family)